MSAPLTSRRLILDRVGAATGKLPKETGVYADLPRKYIRRGALDPEARLKLMIERLREYDAEVVESTSERLPAAIAAQMASSGRHTFVAPEGLPAEWLVP